MKPDGQVACCGSTLAVFRQLNWRMQDMSNGCATSNQLVENVSSPAVRTMHSITPLSPCLRSTIHRLVLPQEAARVINIRMLLLEVCKNISSFRERN